MSGKNFLETLNGRKGAKVPFWFMRQAGRYLPEYRELRAKKGGFLEMVMDPVSACEITMQPIRRFGMDAAIIFSDILVTPMALGQKLQFAEGEGPKLEPIKTARDISKLSFTRFESLLTPIYESLSRVKSELSSKGFPSTALIGFCGAPWTLAAYMIEGGGGGDFMKARRMAYEYPEGFSSLIEILIEASVLYLNRQVEAGAEALQIFDSWAGILDYEGFHRWVIKPTKEIVRRVRLKNPSVPIIGFPRGVGLNYAAYVKETGVTSLGMDFQLSPAYAAKELQPLVPVQGNLDPARLLAGGDAMLSGAREILDGLSSGPFIFNLGHGIHKDTPVEHVEKLSDLIRNYTRP